MNRNRILIGGLAAGVFFVVCDFIGHGMILQGAYMALGQEGKIHVEPQIPFLPLLVLSAYRQLERERPTVPAPSRRPSYAEACKVRDAADAKALRDAAFPSVSLYGLRHSQATLLLRRGVHPKIAAVPMRAWIRP